MPEKNVTDKLEDVGADYFKKKLLSYSSENDKSKEEEKRPKKEQKEQRDEEVEVINSFESKEGSILLVCADLSKRGMAEKNQEERFPIESELGIAAYYDFRNDQEKIKIIEMLAEKIELFENDPDLADARRRYKYFLFESRPFKIKVKKQIIIE